MKSRMQSILNLPAIAVAGMLTTGAVAAEETNRILNAGCESYEPTPANPFRDNIVYKTFELLDFSGNSNANVGDFLRQLECGENQEIHLDGTLITITDLNGTEYEYDATPGEKEDIVQFGMENDITISQDQSNIILSTIETISKLAAISLILYLTFKIPATVIKRILGVLSWLYSFVPTQRNKVRMNEKREQEQKALEKKETSERYTSVHEAGHAALCLLLNLKMNYATIKPGQDYLGAVYTDTNNEYPDIKDVINSIIMGCGGRLAVFLEHGINRMDTGASRDILQITLQAKSICCVFGINDIGFLLDGAESDITKNERIVINSFRGYSPESEEIISDEISQDMDSIIRDCALQGLELLKKHPELTSIISEALFKSKTLTGEQLESIFEQYKEQYPDLFEDTQQSEFDFGTN